MWPELGRELAAEPGEGGPGDVGAAQPRDRFPSASHDQDDAVAAAGHLPAYGGRDVEVRGNCFSDRPQELLRLHREQRRALDVIIGDGVETDVDAAAIGGGIDMTRDRFPVEDVDLRDVRDAAVVPDALGDFLKSRPGAADEEHVGALAGVGARDRGPDRAAAAVDDCGLGIKQHETLLYPWLSRTRVRGWGGRGGAGWRRGWRRRSPRR